MLNVNCKKLSPSATLPTKAHPDDAGWDLYCAEDVKVGYRATQVRTHLSMAIPPGYYGKIEARSGLARDHGTMVLGTIIDSGYIGEIIVLMCVASGHSPRVFTSGEKVAQIIILPNYRFGMVLGDLPPSDRGESGFGSSDQEDHPQGDIDLDMSVQESIGKDGEKCPWEPFELPVFSGRWMTQFGCMEGVVYPVVSRSVPPAIVQPDEGETHSAMDIPNWARKPGESLEDWKKRYRALVVAKEVRDSHPGCIVTLSDDFQTFTVTRPVPQDVPVGSQDAPGGADGPSEVESPTEDTGSLPGASGSHLLEEAYRASRESYQDATRIIEGLLDFIHDLDHRHDHIRPWALVDAGPKSYWKTLKDACSLVGRDCAWIEPDEADPMSGEAYLDAMGDGVQDSRELMEAKQAAGELVFQLKESLKVIESMGPRYLSQGLWERLRGCYRVARRYYPFADREGVTPSNR